MIKKTYQRKNGSIQLINWEEETATELLSGQETFVKELIEEIEMLRGNSGKWKEKCTCWKCSGLEKDLYDEENSI